MSKEAVHFKIAGADFTRLARDFMLSEWPGKAWRLIVKGLKGEGNVERLAMECLDGKKKMLGDESVGIYFVDDNDEEYITSLKFIFAGRVRVGGSWWRPRAVVTDLGPDDATYAAKRTTFDAADPGFTYNVRFFRERVAFYAREGERVYEATRIVKKGRKKVPSKEYVIFEPVGEPPFWWPEAVDTSVAVQEFEAVGRHLTKESWHEQYSADYRAIETTGDSRRREREEADEKRQEAYEALVARVRKEVTAQAKDDWMKLDLNDGNHLMVPRAPFWNWALHRTSLKHLAPEWAAIAPSGMKLPMDDPFHTDWWLGAGLDLSKVYDHSYLPHQASIDAMFELQKSLSRYEAAVLVGGAEVTGVVGTDILVLPNLDPRYVTELPGVRGIITEAGGALAHLAQVALERSIPIMLVKDAQRRYPTKTELTMYPDEGRIVVHYTRH